MVLTKIFLPIVFACTLAACAGNPQYSMAGAESVPRAPEAASGYQEKSGWTAKKFMISAANPLAADAGYEALKAGGSAVDAAIAAQLVLGLVEPQSSGIGGGAFLMHFDGKMIKAYDGRETAPAAATDALFKDADGHPLRFFDAAIGGRSVGVPGVLRMLELAHRQHGKLPWASLFEPAIRLAESGFAVSPRLALLIKADRHLKNDATAASYFYDRHGNPLQAGHILKNPELAKTLREVAASGADAFYRGQIARDIAAKVNAHPGNPGGLTVQDMATYQSKIRAPVCTDYKIWTVCGMPPPSSGGIAIAQMLGILERKNMQSYPPSDGMPTAQAVHLFSEAGRLSYADRDRYVADTDFVPLPGGSFLPLVDKNYLAERAALIGDLSMMRAEPGLPVVEKIARGMNAAPDFSSTSHISIIDQDGHALAMTTTIEDAFGSRQMVRGFLLNNQLTDFSFESADAAGLIANRVQGGKRPRSSMAPTLVLDKASGQVGLAIGSPGGSAIINYVAKVLFGTMDWGLNLQEAINLPNFGSRNGPTELERGRISDALIRNLKQRGHNLRLMEQTSGLHGVMRLNDGGNAILFGAADPRREGIARGD